eukprot:TRINITY_DN38243_c0_g1_i1.p1 TRINITY_DN38243_c0_g1~~TRINITY_DN38243_c0_g1_i1.p1  ORF type:complete len:124 (+),score=42.43 TRINITY_DN38243_c0_g1_i1:144-515(+)
MCIRDSLGYVSLVLIKEVVKGASPSAGGLKANCFTTLAEAHSILRSIVLSRGGNTLLNFQMQECVILQAKQDLYTLLSLIHISEPTRLLSISYAVFCLKKKNNHNTTTPINSPLSNFTESPPI